MPAKFLKEFKEFAVKGNMLDLGVGVIIGGAFGGMISSLVNDIIMPPIGLLTSGADFKDMAVTIKAATATAPAVLIKYGMFVNTIINFLIVALVIFLFVKQINRFRRQKETEIK